jgi:hypothetical protein
MVFTLLAFSARRNFAVFSIAVLPVIDAGGEVFLADAKSWIRGRFSWKAKKALENNSATTPDLLRKVVNLTLVGLLSLVAIIKLYTVTHPALVAAYERSFYPTDALQWMYENRVEGRVFNSYNWGGYQIYRFPQLPVFVDGRTDLYGDAIIQEWLMAARANEGWEETMNKWNIDTILLEKGQPIVRELAKNGWIKRYDDGLAVVFTRSQP